VLNPSYNALFRLIDNECKNIPVSLKSYVLSTDAAEKGHLGVLKWARKNGCPWDELTCEYATGNGHLDVLKWARDNGCLWHRHTCLVYAITNDHSELAKWIQEKKKVIPISIIFFISTPLLIVRK